MLAHSKTIRDVSRALPTLVADPDIKATVSTELLDADTKGLRRQYDNLLPVIDRAGNTLAKAIEKLDPQESPDPGGEGVAALEQAEVYFKHRQEQLRHSRDAFVEVGASPSHEVFEALGRLDNPYTWIIATMQEVRWAVLISEGLKDKAESPAGRSFTSSAEWLASLRAKGSAAGNPRPHCLTVGPTRP